MLIYLGLSAISAFAVSLVLLLRGDVLPAAVAHLMFAVGLAPLIFAAIAHFATVLTRRRPPPGGLSVLSPLLLQGAGGAIFLDFLQIAPEGVLHVAVAAECLVAVAFLIWLCGCARQAVGKPHPGWRWYLVAIGCLFWALLLVPAMRYWPDLRTPLRLVHLHLNLLGFVGLTALGTVQVLLPTALGAADVDATARLRMDLLPALAAVLAVAVGAAWWRPMSLLAALVLLSIGLRILRSWRLRYGWRRLARDGAASALLTALLGWLLALIGGMAHALGFLDGRNALPAFAVAFLLPLLSGALSQLLPVWCRPGRRTASRDRMRAALCRYGVGRSLLFSSGGVLVLVGVESGLWLAVAGVASFLFALIGASRNFSADRGECE